MTRIFTIGSTQTSARHFFDRIRKHPEIATVIDVRLTSEHHLSGFTKGQHLSYFLEEILDVGWEHNVMLAPSKDILTKYKGGEADWEWYTQEFLELMAKRGIQKMLNRKEMDGACLLCFEHQPHFCHRRLVAEYLKVHWPEVEIIHL